jgi:hypothetical protein
MGFAAQDRELLRRLASRVAEIAALPIQAERARLIKSLNDLRPERPVVLAFPEGGWRELVTDADLQCRDALARQWERHLRSVIFHHEHVGDDRPLLPWMNIAPVIHDSGYGLTETRERTAETGAMHWDPPVKSREDFLKLHVRRLAYDRAETERLLGLAEETFDGLLGVRRRAIVYWSVGLTASLVFLRGLDQMMYDMYDNPSLLHELMALLRDDMMQALDFYEAEGLLSLNNGPDDYVGSGGLGHTDELPAKDFAGQVRCRDRWVLAESQETVGVGPEQFEEFVLRYQLPIVQRFGLVCYGCCEPLDKRLDLLIRHMPNLRRVSISPWCNRQVAAEKLGDRYVFSWKPNPAYVCSPGADWAAAERDIRETLRIAQGCCVEMILKDTHTFCNDRSRVGQWVKMAMRLAEG